MAREKIKFALRIAPETQQLVKELCERDNCQSQNEFIEKAIRFYAGYVSGKEATAYLPPALVAACAEPSRTVRTASPPALQTGGGGQHDDECTGGGHGNQ